MELVVNSAKEFWSELVPYWRRAEGVLAVVGFCYGGSVVVGWLWQVTNGIRVHFWSRLWKKDLVGNYGKWAVVTGSTDGIGKGYARQLASKGMNILLVSRTQTKLERVAQEIRSEYGVETDIVQADFSLGRSVYGNIAKHLQGKDIGILVNNVGMLVTPRLFCEISEDDIWAYASVNVASVPAMTRLVLPTMLKRGKGAIINISSLGAYIPLPYMQIYTATKSFVSSFTSALQVEYQSSGVTIQCVEPGAVSTNMTKFEQSFHEPAFNVASPDGFAANAVATLGYSDHTTGFWPHSIQLYALLASPRWLVMRNFLQVFEALEKKKT
ncbi:inactive hydroxysteroid dehydrogenase-like protein 1 isoform X2 [Penaeus japonicus]|uniref:inactive hydroxysteroid dehydrogenase-like protein 1 isoform X2 n=1 Tax=Penaeus japonicus TaxID=27405 RepID=UPI001C713F76|nr:inactive hydroxysteroid dehydrogenase-like protein 1 isoform X2 [Penaeus japonicus]